MKKFVSLLLALVLCVSMVSAGVAETATKTYEFVFIVKSMQFSFMLSMIDGAEAAAKLVDNIHISCIGPETPYSVNEQIELVEQAITNNVDAIMITPADSTGIIPAIESAHAVAYAMKLAPTLSPDQIIVVTISGRGDKDCAAIARYRGEDIHE